MNYQYPDGTFGPRLPSAGKWTDEIDARVVELIKEKYSASQIGTKIGEEFDNAKFSRNAILGRIHRKKLGNLYRKPRENDLALSEKIKAKRVRTWRPEPKQLPEETTAILIPEFDEQAIPAGQRKTLMELTNTICKYPIGDVGTPDFFFCGGNSLDGLPYCAYHSRVAYQSPADRKKDRFGSREGKPRGEPPAVIVRPRKVA